MPVAEAPPVGGNPSPVDASGRAGARGRVTTAARPKAGANDFHALTMDLRAAGLFESRLDYHGVKVALTVAAFVGGWVGFFLLGDSWATLGVAAFLGVVGTQLGFLGHDAGHRQIFESRRANRLLGLGIGDALIGLSYGWWVPKHGAHHAHPNEVGRDPDIAIVPTGGSSAGRPASSSRSCFGARVSTSRASTTCSAAAGTDRFSVRVRSSPSMPRAI